MRNGSGNHTYLPRVATDKVDGRQRRYRTINTLIAYEPIRDIMEEESERAPAFMNEVQI